VRFQPGGLSRQQLQDLPFKANGVYVFLGEIANMPGHCIVAEIKTGRLLSGYHSDNFEELPADEV